ncbi:hypothetical protein KJ836_02385 [Patescibacteria group bacterium]|nr:hypothetical protein [Patescibacteria group bacterium]
MNAIDIETIQKQVLQLLPTGEHNRRGALLADSCSEVSRLVASWIKEMDESMQAIILKGDNVCHTQKSHDILAIGTKDTQFYLLDSTVWQFFPDDDSILIGVADSLDEAIKLSVEKYGGEWKISEEIATATEQEKADWLRIIKTNINDSMI